MVRSPLEKFRPALETRFPGVTIEAAGVGFLRHSENRAIAFAIIPAFGLVVLTTHAGVYEWVGYAGVGVMMGIAAVIGQRLWQRWIVVMPDRIAVMRCGFWNVGPRALEREYPRSGVWANDEGMEAFGWRRVLLNGLEPGPVPMRLARPSRRDADALLAALPVPARPDATAP